MSTLRNPKATDQDCKIDAVLLAKTIMDAYPRDVSRTRMMFSDSNSGTMSEIMVTTGDVKAYATGTISKDDLLTSLELKKVDNAAADRILMLISQPKARPSCSGPFQHDRQFLSDRISKLKQNGLQSKSCCRWPNQSWTAKLNREVRRLGTIQQEIRDLFHRLNEQEQAIKQAQDIARGKTIRHVSAGNGNGTGNGNGNGNGKYEAARATERTQDLTTGAEGTELAKAQRKRRAAKTGRDGRRTRRLQQHSAISPAAAPRSSGHGRSPGTGRAIASTGAPLPSSRSLGRQQLHHRQYQA